MPIDTTDKSLRFRQKQPGKYERYATKKIAPGVEFVLGFDKDGKSEVQSVVFDHAKFDMDDAKKWLKDNDMKAGEGQKIPHVEHEPRISICEDMGYSSTPSMYPGVYMSSLRQMDDSDLRAKRDLMVAARSRLRDEHYNLDDADKYSTSAGRQLVDDIDYYSKALSSIESEMLSRCMALEPQPAEEQ